MLTLTLYKNDNGVSIGDLFLEEQRLLATTHPASIVASIFAMGLSRLKVTTPKGSHTGTLRFVPEGSEAVPLPVLKMRMDMNPELYQFNHLGSNSSEKAFLEGIDLFSNEDWRKPNEVCDEYIRIAHHHLPPALIKHPLTNPEPAGWKKTMLEKNKFIYFPHC